MKNIITASFRLWFTTVLLFTVIFSTYVVFGESHSTGQFVGLLFFTSIIAGVISSPAFIVYLLVLPTINGIRQSNSIKFLCIIFTNIILALLYTAFYTSQFSAWFDSEQEVISEAFAMLGILGSSSFVALMIHHRFLQNHFFIPYSNLPTMNISHETPVPPLTGNNKILYKAIVTGLLIMIMLIPMIFVSNLVQERKQRRKEVEKDVSNKWAAPQTVSGPYLYVPYKKTITGVTGKTSYTSGYFFILPEQLSITGNIDTEERKRSIYKVLLYKTKVSGSGHFQLVIPHNIEPEDIQWSEIKLCMGISDFKGIEQKIDLQFNHTKPVLLPGLPNADIDSNGLSVSVPVNATDIGKTLPFHTQIALRGSGQLHFMPLAGNSSFALQSKWTSPSFDGNTLPTSRKVNTEGFHANWSFNNANLPFTTVITDAKVIPRSMAFGVSLLQPGDEYAQTDRCSKYAILLIGLSFALFFIMEIMQKKPVHPVQYVLVGLALVIFYTLLLSISEITSFDLAYFIAASATILLITVYVHSHFQKAKTAAYFTLLLSLLYGFIFILLRLEDTALLVGSIGLFIILAVVMYASRHISWYQPVASATITTE
jgi:inner membrane protein